MLRHLAIYQNDPTNAGGKLFAGKPSVDVVPATFVVGRAHVIAGRTLLVLDCDELVCGRPFAGCNDLVLLANVWAFLVKTPDL